MLGASVLTATPGLPWSIEQMIVEGRLPSVVDSSMLGWVPMQP